MQFACMSEYHLQQPGWRSSRECLRRERKDERQVGRRLTWDSGVIAQMKIQIRAVCWSTCWYAKCKRHGQIQTTIQHLPCYTAVLALASINPHGVGQMCRLLKLYVVISGLRGCFQTSLWWRTFAVMVTIVDSLIEPFKKSTLALKDISSNPCDVVRVTLQMPHSCWETS